MPVYVSIDIESDGPCPGLNSMLSLGAAAFRPDGTLVSTFSANLTSLPGAERNRDTTIFWIRHAAAWLQATENAREPLVVMREFKQWLETLPGSASITPIAYPAGFDFTWVYYYCHRFLGSSPFSFQCLDLKTYAMSILGTEFRHTSKRTMPSNWFDPNRKHTHVAVDDAVEQGHMFFRMKREWDNIPGREVLFEGLGPRVPDNGESEPSQSAPTQSDQIHVAPSK